MLFILLLQINLQKLSYYYYYFLNFFFIKINITLNFLMFRDVPEYSVFLVLSTAKSNKAVYKLIIFIIHSKYFPNSDWLKAHA